MNKAINALTLLGRTVNKVFSSLGAFAAFFFFIAQHSLTCLRRPFLVVRQLYFIGSLSMVIILVSGAFVGMVLALQMYNTLVRFGSGEGVGMVVALSLVRELGPVLTALLFASRAGSAITAEIGLMKATEQLNALEVMAVPPLSHVVAPRFWAGVISLPLLTAIFNASGILSGFFIATYLLGVDAGTFWSQMQDAVNFEQDVVNGMIKSLVFAVIVSGIAVFQGYVANPTAEGVSAATTGTVVNSALSVLGLDFILTAFMFQP